MDITIFTTQFAALFEHTDPTGLTPQIRFRDIEEWSSLMALSVIAMADEEYHVKLKGDDLRKAQTIQDLYDVIQSRI